MSALPSVFARAVAVAVIVAAGACGALIGWAFVGLQCHGSCTTPKSIGALTGGLAAAMGTSVVAVLGLRAMGEWQTMKSRSD